LARFGNPCDLDLEAWEHLARKQRKEERKNMTATETKKATAAPSETIAKLFQDDHELQTRPSLGQPAEGAAYIALVCLLLFWVVVSVATAICVVALLLPGHLGLSNLAQELGNLLPADPLFYTT
jgi:Flp pilus assembly protein TadB